MTKSIHQATLGDVGNDLLTAKHMAQNPCSSLEEDTDDLFAGKKHLNEGLIPMMKTLRASVC